MKNQQRPVPRAHGDGSSILLHSIFPTIQGEGPFTGVPATFVRLAGCNLQCPLCDTEYTEGATKVSPWQIIDRANAHNLGLIVITGGEPFRQPLGLLIRGLLDAGFIVQIETNGKLPPNLYDHLWDDPLFTVVVSPKTARIDPTVARRAKAFKYVVKAGDTDLDGFPKQALDLPIPKGTTLYQPSAAYTGSIYVQPADEQLDVRNQMNLDAAIFLVTEKHRHNDRRFILGVQTHKIAGLP